jgi:hypothetical protein
MKFNAPSASANDSIAPVLAVVESAKSAFHAMLVQFSERSAGLTPLLYHRYLSMQYHLTRLVQRHFFAAAGHHSLMDRKKLRDFLVNFANEEEPHYLIAQNDLRKMGLEPLPCPLDVALWQDYFLSRVADRPFHRLGATCVLENLGAGAGTTGRLLLKGASFLSTENTRFLDIHFHEVLPHGDQIIAALRSVPLSAEEIEDARKGAIVGSIFYLRLANWVFGADPVLNLFAADDIVVHNARLD